MIYDKLIHYRKKVALTQEQLAEKLHVSRQTITKWETGVSIPSLEYLIDLSELFGVSIDSLIKEDDCRQEQTETNILEEEMIAFLITAKRNTYAAKKGKTTSSRMDSLDYLYQEEAYSYLDSYVGGEKFSGQELVYQNKKVIWSMNYYGRVIGDYFNGDFLKEALMKVEIKTPYRGPKIFVKGDYVYHNHTVGTFEFYHGQEEIYYQGNKIYECLYHGGIIE